MAQFHSFAANITPICILQRSQTCLMDILCERTHMTTPPKDASPALMFSDFAPVSFGPVVAKTPLM